MRSRVIVATSTSSSADVVVVVVVVVVAMIVVVVVVVVAVAVAIVVVEFLPLPVAWLKQARFATLSFAMVECQCPPGHRPIQQQDLAVGKKVIYVSRDVNNPDVPTVIIAPLPAPSDITMNLRNKHGAKMDRVFVANGAEAAEDSPQDGAEAAIDANTNVGTPAAVGTQAAVGASDHMDIDQDSLQDEADKFLKTHIVPWLDQLEQNAVTNAYSMPESLAAALSKFGKSREKLVQAFKEKVPWLPCEFPSSAKAFKKRSLAHLHVVIWHMIRHHMLLTVCSWETQNWC